MGAAIGIGSAIIVGGFMAWAIRKPFRPAEPRQDPESPYSPAGTAIVKELREAAEARQRDLDLRQEWR